MSAWEYWDALERLLPEEWAKEIPDKLIDAGARPCGEHRPGTNAWQQ